MRYVAGIEASWEESRVGVVDGEGRLVRAAKVASEPEALAAFLGSLGLAFARIGREAGRSSQWLHAGLERAGLPVVLIETRHVQAALSAMTMKTDRHEARGIAQLMRLGWFKPGHVKTRLAQEVRALLTARKLLVEKLRDVDNSLRGILRGFGLKVGRVGKAGVAGRTRERVARQALLEAVAEPMLQVHEALRKQHAILHRQLVRLIRDDEVCQRLMTVPGVGPVVAMTYKTAIDDPARFARSKAVGAYVGLVPRKYQFGEIDRTGRITKVGDAMVRTALFEAANVMLSRTVCFSALKAWALRVASRHGMKKAKVALARKLAVVLHRLWVDGTAFGRDPMPAAARAA